MEEKFDVYRNLQKCIHDFCRKNKIKPHDPELIKALKDTYLTLTFVDIKSNYFRKEYDENSIAYKEICKLQREFIQKIIDLIKNNPDLQKMIEDKREEVKEFYGEKVYSEIVPDIRLYFQVDSLEESIKEGTWSPSSDSGISLCLGLIEILGVM